MRTQSEPLALANSARNQAREMDKDLPISNLREYTYFVSKSVAQRWFAMLLLTGFAALALLLALFGIYGVLSYSVNLRTQELAIRQALGAQARDLTALVVRQGMSLVLVGIGIGLGGALALTRLMKTLLFGVSATDPLTFTVIALLLVFVALLACWIPARRAAKVDPMTAMRSEFGVYGGKDFTLTGRGDAERFSGALVSANFLSLLGVDPALGRHFLTEENQPDRSHVAILSYGLWQRRFGGDPQLIGQEVTLDGLNYTVVGVMPPGFQFPLLEAEIWRPLDITAARLNERYSRRRLGPASGVVGQHPLDQTRAAGTVQWRASRH